MDYGGIVSETDQAPGNEEADAKFAATRGCTLATIVLAVKPSLLGNPEDPVVVWKKLRDQFQKKTWVNRLALRHKLYTLQLDRNRAMTGPFNELTV